jgi:Pvc16 N-terminal domain
MSDYRAIAGVSASLRNLLRNRMEAPVDVTIAPPDVTINGVAGRRLNLYLYEIGENGALKNQEIPGHGHPSAYGHPPLSLNLRYLFTAYGDNETAADADLVAQQILGDAMRVLHDFAIITPNLREDDDPTRPRILDPSLVGEFEQVKVTLQPTSLEDFSQIWSALPQANFRRSVAYEVSVVQIESHRPRRFPRPVGEPPAGGPRVYVVPFRRPHIADIRVRRQGDPPGTERPLPYARIGDTLISRGRYFASEATRVILGGLEIPVLPQADGRIEVLIPDDTFPSGAVIPEERRLQPGPQSVEVIVGVAALPQAGFPSNPAVFMLVPRVTGQTPSLNTVPRMLTIAGERLFLEALTGEALVGNAVISRATYLSANPTQIVVPLPDTLPAWPVQCLISGSLAPFPSLTGALDMQVTIGPDGPHTATLATTPLTLPQAVRELQTAIRNAPGGGPAFQGARVAATTAGNQVVIVPGGLGDAVVTTVANTAASTVADQLRLSAAGGGVLVQAYLSGELAPFPVITASQPAVNLTIGGITHSIPLPSRPLTLVDAAAMLEAAIRSAGPEAAFANAQVTTLANQLLLVPGAAGDVAFGPMAGVDETTAAELQLHVRYLVRVRVNGAESIDDVSVEIPL